MISVVICHRNKDLLRSLKRNIEVTIGTEFEFIIIDNSSNNYSIFSAYNEGVKRSKFEIICFMHEDMLYHTLDWGQKIIDHFKEETVGMIGIEGGLSQSRIPSAWWYNNYFANSEINILMRDRKNGLLNHYSTRKNDEVKTEATIVDGVWFCIRTSLFSKITFDEKTFKGFHLYDADISMQVVRYAKVFVVYDILLEHFWTGQISKDFYADLLKFSKKWHSQLPTQTKKVNLDYMKYYNWHCLRSYVLEINSMKFSKKEINEFISHYYPLAKSQNNSLWFRSYFLLSKIIGFAYANRIYYRFEKISAFCKYTSGKKSLFKEK